MNTKVTKGSKGTQMLHHMRSIHL